MLRSSFLSISPPLTIWFLRRPRTNGEWSLCSRFWFRFTAQNNLVGFYFKKMWNISTAILREMARLFPHFRAQRHFCSIWRTVTLSLVSWQHSTTSASSIVLCNNNYISRVITWCFIIIMRRLELPESDNNSIANIMYIRNIDVLYSDIIRRNRK